MIVSYRVIAWMPLIAVMFHLLEEFVWPGGFRRWYRAYRPERAAGLTTAWLVAVNSLLVAIAILAGLLGSRQRGIALWLVVASIGACSAAWHSWATIKTNEYSPGVVTACALYIPLAIYGFIHFARSGIARPEVVVLAAIAGPAIYLFSEWHQRRSAQLRAKPPRGTAR